MTDIKAANLIDEVPEIPEELQKALGHALDRGKAELEKGELLVPFTGVLVKDQVLIAQHPGDNPEECYSLARHEVEGMAGATAYAFCYDGYVDTNQGTKDAIIAEGGVPGESEGFALAYMYEVEESDEDGNPAKLKVDATPTYIGEADNFMEGSSPRSHALDDDSAN